MYEARSLWAVVPVSGLLVGMLTLAMHLVHKAQGKKQQLPPYNREGMFVTLARFMDGTMPDLILDNARTVGKVFRLSMPELRRWFVVCDPKLAKSILENHPEKPDLYKSFDTLYPGVSSMFSKRTHGENWESARKNLAKAFSLTALTSTLPQFDTKLQRLIAVFEEAAGNKKSVDISAVMLSFTFDFLTCSMFDIDLDAMGDGPTQGKEILHHMEFFLKEFYLKQVFNPFRKYMFWDPEIRRAMKSAERFKNLNAKILSDYRANHSKEIAEADASILGHIVKGAYRSDNERYAEMMAFLIGGHDTTGLTLSWILIEIARHPRVWEKVHAEIVTNTPEGVFPIPYAAMSRLPYLDMVIKEGMRLWPVGALGSIRETASDIEFGDMVIPKGVTVMLPFYAITREGIQVQYFPPYSLNQFISSSLESRRVHS